MHIDWKRAALSFLSVLGAMLLGILLGGDMKSVYLSLQRPFFAPPPLAFPIAWSILYLLMGFALYRALSAQRESSYAARRGMLTPFFSGLVLSALWPMVFFRFQLFTLGFFLIVAMLAIGAFTASDFYKVNRTAFFCYLPYLLWLLFALLLNYQIAQLNG